MRSQVITLFASAAFTLGGTGGALAWGALVIDARPGDTVKEIGRGWSTGYSNKQEAIDAAMKECKGDLTDDQCKLLLTFPDCAAFAFHTSSEYAVGSGATRSEAESSALKICGSEACEIVPDLTRCDHD